MCIPVGSEKAAALELRKLPTGSAENSAGDGKAPGGDTVSIFGGVNGGITAIDVRM
jgi:hypothetical protein